MDWGDEGNEGTGVKGSRGWVGGDLLSVKRRNRGGWGNLGKERREEGRERAHLGWVWNTGRSQPVMWNYTLDNQINGSVWEVTGRHCRHVIKSLRGCDFPGVSWEYWQEKTQDKSRGSPSVQCRVMAESPELCCRSPVPPVHHNEAPWSTAWTYPATGTCSVMPLL